MSICRWSCDNMQSDVYAYQAYDDGFVVHISHRHPVNTHILGDTDEELVMKYLINNETQDTQEYEVMRDHRKEQIQKLEWRDIDRAYAGQTYNFDTIEELRSMLEKLSNAGLHVPAIAFENIERIANEDLADSE